MCLYCCTQLRTLLTGNAHTMPNLLNEENSYMLHQEKCKQDAELKCSLEATDFECLN